MKAVWQGRVIAESDGVREDGGYTYFPREAVRMELLQSTPKTESDLACPSTSPTSIRSRRAS